VGKGTLIIDGVLVGFFVDVGAIVAMLIPPDFPTVPIPPMLPVPPFPLPDK
jgi:hypothetical protein